MPSGALGPTLRRALRHGLEAAAVLAAFPLFRLLPVETASNLGGWLGRSFGRRLGVSDRARRNLALALPELTEAAREAVVTGMWDNLGRTAAELPHLRRIADPASGRVELVDATGGTAPADPFFLSLRPAILVSGHLANWEVISPALGQDGLDLAIIARAPNNPLLRGPLERLRDVAGGRRIPKGAEGARTAIAVLQHGGTLGMLADQRMSDGIEAPFFGRPAMTAAGPAQLALKFGCPLVPLRLERLGPARFRLTRHPPLAPPAGGDRRTDALALTRALNALLEDWIREKPEDWLWLHRRWGEESA